MLHFKCRIQQQEYQSLEVGWGRAGVHDGGSDSWVLELTKFELAHSKRLIKQGQIQGELDSVRYSREFEINKWQGLTTLHLSLPPQ